jgi:hypothetical protein
VFNKWGLNQGSVSDDQKENNGHHAVVRRNSLLHTIAASLHQCKHFFIAAKIIACFVMAINQAQPLSPPD